MFAAVDGIRPTDAPTGAPQIGGTGEAVVAASDDNGVVGLTHRLNKVPVDPESSPG